VNSGTDPTSGGSVISLPSGGGAIGGLGEKFSADLFTGTGNFSVPIGVPAGRGGLQPQLSVSFSTGNGNGPFGLGWGLSLPGIGGRQRHHRRSRRVRLRRRWRRRRAGHDDGQVQSSRCQTTLPSDPLVRTLGGARCTNDVPSHR